MAEEFTITLEEKLALETICKEAINLADALVRLQNNNDFKLFMKEFCEREPVRLTELLADPALFSNTETKEFNRNNIHEQLLGIAVFKQYQRVIMIKAEQAKKQLLDLSEAKIEDYVN